MIWGKIDQKSVDKVAFKHARERFSFEELSKLVDSRGEGKRVYFANIATLLEIFPRVASEWLARYPTCYSNWSTLDKSEPFVVFDFDFQLDVDLEQRFADSHGLNRGSFEYYAVLATDFADACAFIVPRLCTPARKVSSRVKVSCIVLSGLDNCATLTAMLRSFVETTHLTEMIELIVIVNGSNDASFLSASRVLEGYSDAITSITRCPANLGVAGGFNLGMDQARGEYVCLLQDDITFTDPDWLSCLARNMDRYPQIGLLGGFRGSFRYRNQRAGVPFVSPTQPSVGTRLFGSCDCGLLKEKLVEVHDVSCMCTIHRAGMKLRYDERWLPNGLEDIAFSFEVRQLVYKVFVTDVGILHATDKGSATRRQSRRSGLLSRYFGGIPGKRTSGPNHSRRFSRGYHYREFERLYGDMLQAKPADIETFDDAIKHATILPRV